MKAAEEGSKADVVARCRSAPRKKIPEGVKPYGYDEKSRIIEIGDGKEINGGKKEGEQIVG